MYQTPSPAHVVRSVLVPGRRLLDATELFAELPDDALTELGEQAVVRDLERNEVLFRQGDPSARCS